MENGEDDREGGGGGEVTSFLNIFLLVVLKEDCIPKISFLSVLEVPTHSLSEGGCAGGEFLFLAIIRSNQI